MELIAFVFAVFTLYGCGAEPVLYGVVLLVLGIPVFVWQRRRSAEGGVSAHWLNLVAACN